MRNNAERDEIENAVDALFQTNLIVQSAVAIALLNNRSLQARVQTQLRADRERLNRLLGLWGKQTAWQIESELSLLLEKELAPENIESLAVSQRFDLAAVRREVANVRTALKLKKSVRWIVGTASIGIWDTCGYFTVTKDVPRVRPRVSK